MFIKNFSEINKNSVAEAGGKGASLGEMTKAKIPVPPGIVILSGAFYDFLAATDLTQEVAAQLAKVNYQDINSVDRYSNVIRSLISKAPLPPILSEEILKAYRKMKAPLVAVRSSATAEDSSIASWAGELETYLHTTEKNLLLNIGKSTHISDKSR